MQELRLILRFVHLVCLAFGLGGATANLVATLGARSNGESMASVMKALEPIGKLIYAGLIGLILAGIGFVLLGYYPETSLLLVKHVLVGILFVTGTIIVFYLGPKLSKLSPKPRERPAPQFLSTMKQAQALGVVSLILWYAITAVSVFL